jgi:hypothetical protein
MSEIKYHYDLEQGTDEWHKTRIGIVTASVMNQLVTPTGKIANNDKVKAFVYEIAAQRITGTVEQTYTNGHMERGHIEEGLAKVIYSANYAPVTECGFISCGLLGYSPDGLVGEPGLLEIKGRVQKKQVAVIAANEVPVGDINQCQFGLYLTKREWIDYISYSNGMPMFVKRVTPDLELHAKFTEAIEVFENQVNEQIELFKLNSVGLQVADRLDYECMMNGEVII